MDDPVAGENNDKTNYSTGDGLFTLGGFFGIAAAHDDGDTTKEEKKEEDDAGKDVGVGENVGDNVSEGVVRTGD